MLFLNFLLASTPIMSPDDIYAEANRCFGSNFTSFQEMERVNPVVFSELANAMYDPRKIAFLKMIAAKKGCEESRDYLETILGKEINYSASEEEEALIIENVARKIEETRKIKSESSVAQDLSEDRGFAFAQERQEQTGSQVSKKGNGSPVIAVH